MGGPIPELDAILPDLKRIFGSLGDGPDATKPPPAKSGGDPDKLLWEQDFPKGATNQEMQKAAIGKRLIQISRDDITPKNYEDFSRLAGYPKDMPAIYYDANDLNDKPLTKLMKDDNGTPYIIANQPALQVTPQFVRKHWQRTDKELQEKADSGEYTKVNRDTAAALFDFEAYDKILQKMGIKEMPDIYIDTKNDSKVPELLSAQTSDGKKHYIVINQAAIKDVTSADMLTAALSHEFAHFKNGDTAPENIAKRHNEHKGKDDGTEAAADRDGASAACDPKVMQDFLRIHDQHYREEFRKKHGKVSDGEIDASYAEGDNPHPTGKQRIDAMQNMIEHMPEGCPAPKSTPTAKTPPQKAPAHSH